MGNANQHMEWYLSSSSAYFSNNQACQAAYGMGFVITTCLLGREENTDKKMMTTLIAYFSNVQALETCQAAYGILFQVCQALYGMGFACLLDQGLRDGVFRLGKLYKL